MRSKQVLRILAFVSAVSLTTVATPAQCKSDSVHENGSSWIDQFRPQRCCYSPANTLVEQTTSQHDESCFNPQASPDTLLNAHSSCGESICPSCSTSSYCCDPCRTWTFQAGAILLHRERPDSQPLFSDPAIVGSGINANGFNLGWGTGVDASLIRHHAFQANCDLELRYFGIDTWSDTQSSRLNGSPLVIHNNPPTFITGGRDISSHYSLNLLSTESNLRHRVVSRVTLLGGFRYLQFNEQLNTQLTNAPAAGDIHYNVAANNDLFGVQAGLLYDLFSSCDCCVQLYGKAGIYANQASQSTSLTNFSAPAATFAINDRTTQLASVGEFGMTGSKRIWKNVALRGGCQVLALDGVATGPGQFPASSFVNQSGLGNNDTVIFHGATIGLELTY